MNEAEDAARMAKDSSLGFVALLVRNYHVGCCYRPSFQGIAKLEPPEKDKVGIDAMLKWGEEHYYIFEKKHGDKG